MARVLLTDAQERAVLAAARSLEQAGYEVSAAAAERFAVTHWSRSCDERPVLPSPAREPERFADALVALVQSSRYDVLIPGSDAALRSIVAARGILEPHVRIGLPPPHAVERSFDRLQLSQASATTGLRCPPTVELPGSSELSQAAAELRYPLVIKTRWPVLLEGAAVAKVKSRLVNNAPELIAAAPYFGTDCVLQSVVSGHEISCGGVMTSTDGLLALAVSRYRRTWPVVAGDVCFSESVAVPDGLWQQLEALMRRVGWTGIFELELIQAADGSFAPIDLNPRVYGSLALAVAAGAPLPAIWADWLLQRSSPRRTAAAGQLYRREDGDLPHAWWQLRHRRWRAALAPLRPRRGVTHALFRRDDPGPLLARCIRLAITRASKYRARAGSV